MIPIGIVGLGRLGLALAGRLLDAGYAVVGHDIAPGRVHAFEALGGKGAGSAQDVAESAETIGIVLPTADAVQDAILGPEGVVMRAKAGAAVVQMSTIAPALTARLLREVTAQGLTFLDCPVSGTSSMVARGEGVIICGGERAAVERERPVLEAMLPNVVHVGPAGHGTLVKMVANLLVGLHTAAAAEALTMARKAGLDLALVLKALDASAAASRMLEVRGPMMAHGMFAAQMTLGLFVKDLHLAQDAGRSVGASLPLTDVAERLYSAAVEAGHADEDIAAVIRALPS